MAEKSDGIDEFLGAVYDAQDKASEAGVQMEMIIALLEAHATILRRLNNMPKRDMGTFEISKVE